MATTCPKCHSDNPDTQRYCGDCGTPLVPSEDGSPSITKTLETPVRRLEIGSLFAARYKILEELGKGGMGEVYRVRDEKLGEEIALKVLKPEIATDRETIERFKNELKFSRKIAHRHVCKMYDLGEEGEIPFITMECVKGKTLKSLLREEGKLDEREVTGVATQICEGLVEAHQLGVVHRDLKSQNIMIDEKGNAKIMDFGIARSLEAPGVTRAGVMIGTPDYISPEQAEGVPADHRSDIYSMGIILYEMTTGSLPFKSDTAFGVALKHKTQPPLDPRKLNPEISENLNRLILVCMEKDRERRYQSAKALLADLKNIEEGFPLGTQIRPRRKTFAARLTRKKLLIPGLVIVLAIIAVVTWQSWLRKEKTAAPVQSNKPLLAIMYFQNNTGDKSLDVWRDGLSRMLIADLSQSKYMRVLPDDRLYSILSQLNLLEATNYTTEDLKEVAGLGRSTHIVKGFFTRSGDSFRINTTLQESSAMEIVGSEAVEGTGEASFFTMVDELTKRIKANFALTAGKMSGDIDDDIRKITTSSPEAYKYYSEGTKLLYKGDNLQSVQFMEKAVAIDPDFGAAYGRMAAAYSNLTYYAERDRCLKKAMELGDRLSEYERYSIQAYFYHRVKNEYDKAIGAWNKVLALYPEDNIGNNMLGILYRELEQWDKAIERFEVNVQNMIQSPSSYANQAMAYMSKGLYDKAGEVLNFYLKNVSESPVIYNHLSINYILQEKYDLALETADKSISLWPYYFYLIFTKGTVYHCQGNFTEAEREYQNLLAEKNQAAHFWGRWSLGALYLQQGKLEKSREQLRQGIELAEKLGERQWKSDFLKDLIYSYLISGRLEDALEKCNEMKSIAEESEGLGSQRNALYWLAYSHIEMRLFDKAQQIMNELKALTDKETNKKLMRFYYHLMGRLELAKDNLSNAIQYFEESISMLPHQSNVTFWHALAIDSLALAHYRSGDLDKASQEYEKIISLTSGRLFYGDIYVRSFYMLGKIYEQKGWKGKALENYEKFLDLWKDADPGLPGVEDARKRRAGLKE